MQPLFEHRLELAGYETRALELEGDGPPLILFHGFADSADTWRLLLDRLARAGRRAIAFDLPGYGTADPLDDGRGVLEQLEAFGAAAIESSAPDGGALLCGNSLGGCLSMRLAEQPGLGIAGIVPVAPAGLDMARWFTIIEREPVLRALLAVPAPIPRPLLQTTVAEIYRRLAFRRPGTVEPHVARTFASHFGDRAATLRILASGRRLIPEIRDPFDLDRIDCPVLLVWGSHDLLVFPTGAARVLETVAEARLETIDGCGQSPQLEAPDRLAELVVGFPESLAAAA